MMSLLKESIDEMDGDLRKDENNDKLLSQFNKEPSSSICGYCDVGAWQGCGEITSWKM